MSEHEMAVAQIVSAIIQKTRVGILDQKSGGISVFVKDEGFDPETSGTLCQLIEHVSECLEEIAD